MQQRLEDNSEQRLTQEQFIRQFARSVKRFKRHPDELDQLLVTLQGLGMDEATVAKMRRRLKIVHAEWQEGDSLYDFDRYLITGVGILDLLLLPVIIPLGTPDVALLQALLMAVISLVFVALSLNFDFANRKYGNTHYGLLHSWINVIAELAGAGALAALLLHVNPEIGIVFMVLTIVAFIIDFAHMMRLRFSLRSRTVKELLEPEAPTFDTPPTDDGCEHDEP